jgi:hypothetical protein
MELVGYYHRIIIIIIIDTTAFLSHSLPKKILPDLRWFSLLCSVV